MYPINVKTAEPIWSNFFVGPHVTTRKVYNDKKCVLKVFNFVKKFKFLKSEIFLKIHNFFSSLFQNVNKKNQLTQFK